MSNVEKMTIALTPQMAGFVRHVVQTGQYASTSEAIREAVREWQERRDLLGYTVEELRVLVQEGIDSGEPQVMDFATLKQEARAQLASRKG